MRTPAQLRKDCRSTIRAAKREPDPHLKRLMARHALALAQLAEKIERDQPAWTRAPMLGAGFHHVRRVRSLLSRRISGGSRRDVATPVTIADSDGADE